MEANSNTPAPLTPAQTRAIEDMAVTGRAVHIGTFDDGTADVEVRSGQCYWRYALGKRGRVTFLYCGTR